MAYKNILWEIHDTIGVLSFNRPQALNALNAEVFSELELMLNEIEKDNHLRVLLITGTGKAFIAGADIKELEEMNSKNAYDFSKRGQDVLSRVEKLPFPTIAVINGFALGGGLELALACDLRFSSTLAKMGMPEASLGLIPGFGGTYRLAELIGYAGAMFLMSTAAIIDASEALRLGLVQMLAEPGDLMDKSMEIARKISSRGPNAIRTLKKVLIAQKNANYSIGSEIESKHFSALFQTRESKEGIVAFLQKRKPSW